MLRIESTALRVTLLVIGIAFLLLFLLPFAFHIVNIGNLFGLGASAVLIGFVLLNRPLADLLEKLWQQKGGKIALSVLGVVLLLGVLYCLTVSVLMIHAAGKQTEQPPAAVIVLGCKVRGTEPSLMLSRRIKAAYAVLTENPELICIVSGGKGDNEAISEAQCMAERLIAMGIPAERILREDKSTSTSENLRFSKAILEQEGITGPLLLATDGYHELRAQMLAKKEGLPECGAASAYTSWYLLPTYWVREWFGVAHAVVFGN